MPSSMYEEFSRFDSAQGPSNAGGINMADYSRIDSSKNGSSIGNLNDFNRIDSFKLGSIGG